MKNIIDCTLRDGGYYTNWNFDSKFIKNLFKFHFNISSLHFEIGYKNPITRSPDDGLFQLTPEKYIKDVYFEGRKWPAGKKVFVMFDAKSIFEFSKFNSLELYVENLNSNEVWNGVRIATSQNLLEFSLNFAKLLKKRGIYVAINLMRMHSLDFKKVIEILGRSENILEILDVLYVADSFGSATSKELEKVKDNLKPFLDEKGLKLGFHAHNNRGLALSNSLFAEKLGFDWIDGSWLGMGRGAGNAELEHLILDLSSNASNSFDDVYKFLPISTFNYLSELKQKYKWGKNIEYDIASRLNVHPSFVSDLASEKCSNSEHKINTLFTYSRIINKKSIINGDSFYEVNSISDTLHKEKNNENCILLFGGESATFFSREIKKLREYNSFPIFLANFDFKLRSIYEPDLILTSSLLRFQSFVNTIQNSEELSILVPNESFAIGEIGNKSIKVYLDKKRSEFELTLDFALDIILRSDFKNVYIAGLDGSKNVTYASQNENINTSSTIKKYKDIISIQSFTYTQFNLPVKSIYSIL